MLRQLEQIGQRKLVARAKLILKVRGVKRVDRERFPAGSLRRERIEERPTSDGRVTKCEQSDVAARTDALDGLVDRRQHPRCLVEDHQEEPAGSSMEALETHTLV